MKTIVVKPKHAAITASIITAADDDEFTDSFDDADVESYDDDTDGIMDAIDDVADNVEDLRDTVDDVKKDDVDIAINNNIEDHYIAECESCQGVFISAVIESNQKVDHVSGVCPLCGRETDQYLKWVIKKA